jgi:hypothetical protein
MTTDWGRQEKDARIQRIEEGARVSAASDGCEGVKQNRNRREKE